MRSIVEQVGEPEHRAVGLHLDRPGRNIGLEAIERGGAETGVRNGGAAGAAAGAGKRGFAVVGEAVLAARNPVRPQFRFETGADGEPGADRRLLDEGRRSLAGRASADIEDNKSRRGGHEPRIGVAYRRFLKPQEGDAAGGVGEERGRDEIAETAPHAGVPVRLDAVAVAHSPARAERGEARPGVAEQRRLLLAEAEVAFDAGDELRGELPVVAGIGSAVERRAAERIVEVAVPAVLERVDDETAVEK